MSEHPLNDNADLGEDIPQDQPSYKPASIYTRIYAWIGVVYMVLAVLLVTWWIATGAFLTGITGIMLAPALIGFAIAKGIQAKNAEFSADRIGPAIWCALCGVAGVVSLVIGVGQLMRVV